MFHPDELRQISFHSLSLRRQGKRLSRCVLTGNIVMLHRTTTPYAPWTIVESNCKRYARVKVLEIVCEAIRQRLE